MRLVTAAQMREIDRISIEQPGISGLQLMERAGVAVADATAELLPPGGTAVIVAGKGNNGGDGLVAARHLLERGYDTPVILLAQADELTGEAATNYQRAVESGVAVHQQPDDAAIAELLSQADVVVDAVLGTGLTGQVHGRSAEVLGMLAQWEGPVVAVDIPSGLNADTGALLGPVPRARITVTMGLAKTGLWLYPGRDLCTDIRVAEIGLHPEAVNRPDHNTWLTEATDVAQVVPKRAADAHKGDAGRVLVVAGSTGLTGAAAMAAMAAARSGAGLVTVACPATLNTILEVKCTEAMTAPLMDHGCGWLGPQNRYRLLELAEGADCVVLGPGLGAQAATAELVRSLAAELHGPVLLDADGINAFAGHAEALAHCPGKLVLTPHPGELARLTGTSVADLQADRLTAARKWAARLGVTMVLKGAATVCADRSGEAWINSTGNSGMASGGMGDVLSGIIGALLAEGARSLQAAWAGVWLHGRAADLAAAQIGPRGYLATDLPAIIPAVYAELL
jgi:ADP-dependent NAD(P)H-hydrate dehydratase / NAD(P)H-hydrate epimerase